MQFLKAVFILLINFQLFAQLSVSNLNCEHLNNPLGLDVTSPRFGWHLVSDIRNTKQIAYEIQVGLDENMYDENLLIWKSGKVLSDSSVHVTYKGKRLKAGEKYFWKVRVWDNHSNISKWSKTAFWQMGKLDSTDWAAKWIQHGFPEDSLRTCPLFRKTFSLNKKIKSAYAYITAHGLYESFINGKRIGDAYLTPGWTSYNKRLQYQVYDVAGLLSKDENVIGSVLGNGWYRGLGSRNNRNAYGKETALLFQLDVTFTDGSKQSIISDASWKCSTGGIINPDIYNGETVDARLEKNGWLTNYYNDSNWSAVKEANYSLRNLVSTYNEPITKHEVFLPKKLITTPKGEKIIDFGQNLVGWVQVKIKGNEGDKIVIKHAEVLDKHGNFYTDNLRSAKAEAVYILKGSVEETFEPRFTFFGFRFIKIEGINGEINPENLKAIVLHSNMTPTGNFSCSDSLINQLQHNILWGQKGNFLDVPTDCPQRDERLGWTGDAQVFSRTASFNMNVNNFFAKWLKDLSADQLPNGVVPWVIPNVLKSPNPSSGWSDAATIISWNMYLAYGDKRILENQYSSMKEWVEYMRANSKNDLFTSPFHFGDWLFFSPDVDDIGRAAVTDKSLIGQCFYSFSTQLLINAAKVLNKKEDVTFYTDLLSKIKSTFMNEFVTPNGKLVSSTQTAYVLALQFDMLPESIRKQAADRLIENIKSYGDHLTTGFLGTPYLCHVLSRFGYTDVAYKLLFQQTYPSWLYPVKMGATTIWERWNGIKPDGTFHTPNMNSFNHYAYGAIGDWLYRVVCGIDTENENPGYKVIKIDPHTGNGLSWAEASLETYYGKITSHWKNTDSKFELNVEIPNNTSALIYLPAESVENIFESGKSIAMNKEIEFTQSDNNKSLIKVGSGKYLFSVQKKK